jgi:hypothetical protein
VRFRLFGQHFNSNGDGDCPYFFSPSAGQYPDLMMVGHGHDNVMVQSIPYYVLETQQACNKGSVAFLEFQKNGTEWSCPGMSNHPASTCFQVMETGDQAKVSNTFACANDGSACTNTATIVNNLPFDFWDGRVRFLMRRPVDGYQVAGGEKLAEYSCNNGSNTAVLVKVCIAADTTTMVTVTGVGVENPFVDITNEVFEATAMTSCSVAGTNNAALVGNMWASNAATGQRVVFPALPSWTTPALTIAADTNFIHVYGTNVIGTVAGDTVVVVGIPEPALSVILVILAIYRRTHSTAPSCNGI